MTAPARQPAVDTPVPCHYAADPARRPRCTLTAAVRVGAIPLCRPCLAAASTLGKGEPAIPLRPGPPTGALDQITAAGQQLAAAHAGLAAAVTRARQAGYPWSAIGASLGISRQAAQQRFSTPSQATLTGATHSSSQSGKNRKHLDNKEELVRCAIRLFGHPRLRHSECPDLHAGWNAAPGRDERSCRCERVG